MSREVLVVAGEASGDALGAGVIGAARAIDPAVRFFGIGGDAMRAVGCEILVDAGSIAVVGLVEVLASLPRLLAARRTLRAALRTRKPSTVLLIDYPDFNLRFARDARRAGARVVYLVSPQVWAWRSGRIRQIAQLVDRMIVVFPFEVDIYEKAGVPVTFVGHPLVDSEPPSVPTETARARLGLAREGRLLGLLPGSRPGEVRRLLPPLLGAATMLRATRPDLVAVVPVASTVPPDLVEGILAAEGASWVHVAPGRFHDVLDAADAAIVASGTATLQAGFRQVPMVVVYAIHRTTAWIARRLIRVPAIGLVNLVAGRRVVPELIQERCTPAEIARTVAPLLDDPAAAASMRRELSVIRDRLGAPGASERAARTLLAELESAPSGSARDRGAPTL